MAILGYGLQPVDLVAVAAADPDRADPLRFELIETSEAAEVDEPRDSDSPFVSDRNTRSQQRELDPDVPATGAPRIPQEGESHDLRQVGTAPERGLPSPPTAPPSSPSRPSPPLPPSPSSRAQPQQEEDPDREPASPPTGIQVRPEPIPDALPPERTRDESRDEPWEEPREEPIETQPAPSSRPRPATPPSPAAPPAEQETPPTAFQLGERVQPGRPSLSPVEQDLLARAEAEGEISFEATKHFFADYYLRIKREIENTWVLLITTRYKSMDPSRASFEFLVLPDGSIAGLRPLGAEGDELFPLVSGLAIRNSAPFGPVPYEAVARLPASAQSLPLRIQANFNLY